MEDFLNRRTSYSYNTGYNYWLLSKIEYPTSGYTTYVYSRFADSGYYKYYVTDQKVYETSQVRHAVYSYTGTFEKITSSTMTMKNESDVTQGSYDLTTDNLVTQKTVKNASGSAIRKYVYTYDSQYELTQESVYKDGSTLSYTNYHAYDNWGNLIYFKNALGHEQFFSYANTSTSGFFIDNTGAVIRTFTNAFSNSTVPSSVHTALLGMVEKQDNTYVKERYLAYDSEAHFTQTKNAFGNATTWLTFSGTFNEKLTELLSWYENDIRFNNGQWTQRTNTLKSTCCLSEESRPVHHKEVDEESADMRESRMRLSGDLHDLLRDAHEAEELGTLLDRLASWGSGDNGGEDCRWVVRDCDGYYVSDFPTDSEALASKTAHEFWNSECKHTYKEECGDFDKTERPPDFCLGTSIISIFVGLSTYAVFARQKREFSSPSTSPVDIHELGRC